MAKQNKRIMCTWIVTSATKTEKAVRGSVNTWTTYQSGNTKKQRTLIVLPRSRNTQMRKKTEGEDFLAPLYFDLDYSENPAVAQKEAIKLVEFFTGELDIQEQDLHIYFSGSRGFHILVDERALG